METVQGAAGQAEHDAGAAHGEYTADMKVYTVNDQVYRLSSTLNPFQRKMQMHLVDWKWAHITHEAGFHNDQPNDAILPKAIVHELPMLYPPIRSAVESHRNRFPFPLHQFFNHVASSQAANLNLFLPILLHPNVDIILREIKPDFDSVSQSELDHGYRIEYWDEPYGTLGDRTHISGTDADIAIAYYNHQGELCLWLIEHKLTENEFTTCGGSKSRGRQAIHDCRRSFSQILDDKQACYYHSANHHNFWNITDVNQAFFVNHAKHLRCPFMGGMNQLWRNQLLALSIEQDERQPYKHVTFSVVRHPHNTYLDRSVADYQDLIANNPKFSVFTSKDVLDAAVELQDLELDQWIAWYQQLYAI
jgi:hypothetical protein